MESMDGTEPLSSCSRTASRARCVGAPYVPQVEQHRLFSTRWKTQVLARRRPATFSIRHFQGHWLCTPTIALCDCNVE